MFKTPTELGARRRECGGSHQKSVRDAPSDVNGTQLDCSSAPDATGLGPGCARRQSEPTEFRTCGTDGLRLAWIDSRWGTNHLDRVLDAPTSSRACWRSRPERLPTNRKPSLDAVERGIEMHLKRFIGNRRMASMTTADIREYIAGTIVGTVVAMIKSGCGRRPVRRDRSANRAPLRQRAAATRPSIRAPAPVAPLLTASPTRSLPEGVRSRQVATRGLSAGARRVHAR